MLNKSQMLVAVTGLEDFSPGCSIRELWTGLPQCGNIATLAVVWHRNCYTTISCVTCWARFLAAAIDWLDVEDADAQCVQCGEVLPEPLMALRSVPL